ncbi:MAG: type III pantothenate kinase [Planctomycetota bacterium]|nr:type III pantothenate kinase [Planctomycetota bacterium]
MKRILLVDAGNSNAKWFFADEPYSALRTVATIDLIKNPVLPDADVILLCSVVESLRRALKDECGQHLVVLGQDMEVPIANATHRPAQVGEDRLVASYAAHREAGGDVAVFGCGTALATGLVKDGEFTGGNIVPGPRLQVQSLLECASDVLQGDDVLRRASADPVGRTTGEAVNKGVGVFLKAGVEHLCAAYGNVLDKPRFFAWGGWSKWLCESTDCGIEHKPDLVFCGLRHISQEKL